jgi:hypothetical protein
MKSFRLPWFLGLLFAASICFAQNNPVPFVNQPLVPAAIAPGSPQFSLTVTGAGFVLGSTVDWNGTALATTFVSADKLTAVVPASNISRPGTAYVTVVSPTPGGGNSNPVPFTITAPPCVRDPANRGRYLTDRNCHRGLQSRWHPGFGRR